MTKAFTYAWALGLMSATLLSCSIEHALVCDTDEQCVRDEVPGSCILSQGSCAFADGECMSGLRWDSTATDGVASQCVDSATSVKNECGGSAILSSKIGLACGACNVGILRCDGLNATVCEGGLLIDTPVATQGVVSASAELSAVFRAELGVDEDDTTSWFSAGPTAVDTEYNWTGVGDDCISHVQIVSNGKHSNAAYRRGYGFGEVTVQVLNAESQVVYSQSADLAGTPDPTVEFEPNVVGRGLRLVFTGHESADCGGFSELSITASR